MKRRDLKGRVMALETALLPSPPVPGLQIVFAVREASSEVRTTNAQGGEQRLTTRAPGVYVLPDNEREDGGLWIHAA